MAEIEDIVPVLDIVVHQKQDYPLEVQILGEGDVPINVEAPGTTCFYDIFDASGGGDPIISKTEVDMELLPEGVVKILLTAEDTNGLTVPVGALGNRKEYRHNLFVISGGENIKAFTGRVTTYRSNSAAP